MGTRGRKRRLDLESEYWRLLSAGMGTVEACREIGVGRKTGFRWRQENGGLPPSRISEDNHSGRYLAHFERLRIAALAELGHGVREIGRRLEQVPSPISRELRRNSIGARSRAMTAIWPMPGHGSEPSAPGSPGWVWMTSSARWWPTSSNSNGALSRSPFISGPPTRLGRNGISALKRSTRPSMCPEEVA